MITEKINWALLCANYIAAGSRSHALNLSGGSGILPRSKTKT